MPAVQSPNPKRQRVTANSWYSGNSYNIQLDSLGKSACAAAALLSSGLSFFDLCQRHRGFSCLADTSQLPHPAAGLLARLRRSGAPVLLAQDPWTLLKLDLAIQRGPHQSTKAHAVFLRQELSEMVAAGQWLVLPYRCVRHLRGLRLSPMGVVPQRDRRPRPIVDYTFYGINEYTISLAPDSMQFGRAFERLLQKLHRADTRHGPVYISKVDISDAFMRVWIQLHSIPILGAIIPSLDGEEPMVGFPMILPMGWIDSPPFLCAVTEMIADLTNAWLAHGDIDQGVHHLDTLADSKPASVDPIPAAAVTTPPGVLPSPLVCSRGPLQAPLQTVDVYMDDFITLTQHRQAEARRAVRRTLFATIDQVLRPLSAMDNPCRKEPNSTKKLAKGDAAWSTKKVILGWLIDTVRRSIELPPHRVQRLADILDDIPRHQRRTSRRKWQQLLGEIRSMTLAIPGGRGLLSQLQAVLTYSPTARPSDRLNLLRPVHDQLDDLRWLARDLGSRPTQWGEVVDGDPAFLGAVDASADGMGGIWLDALETLPPLLWRQPFPPTVSQSVISWSNPTGSLTNSDLEEAGLICHQDILAQQYDLRERTICSLSDNTPAIARDRKGSTSSDSAAAYLCRVAALHQRAYRYRLRTSHVPGSLNVMADTLSRRWDLTDSQMLHLFNTSFPQAQPWAISQLRPAMNSSVMQALWKERCGTDFLQDATLHPAPTGISGVRSVNNIAWRPTLPRQKIQSLGFKSSVSEYATAGLHPMATLSDLAQWQTPSYLLHRRTPCWVKLTPAPWQAAAQ